MVALNSERESIEKGPSVDRNELDKSAKERRNSTEKPSHISPFTEKSRYRRFNNKDIKILKADKKAFVFSIEMIQRIDSHKYKHHEAKANRIQDIEAKTN